MSIVYHVTTPKKLLRYQQTGFILSPVRYWSTFHSARKWAVTHAHIDRTIILSFEKPKRSWPLPISKIKGAYWTDELVWVWTEVKWL